MGETSGPNRRRRRKTGRRRTEKRGEIAKGTLRNRRNRGKEAGKQGKETRKQGKEKQEKGRGTAAKDRTREDRDLVTRFPQKARLGYRVEILLPISACHARKPGRGARDSGTHCCFRICWYPRTGTHAATGHCTPSQAQGQGNETLPRPLTFSSTAGLPAPRPTSDCSCISVFPELTLCSSPRHTRPHPSSAPLLEPLRSQEPHASAYAFGEARSDLPSSQRYCDHGCDHLLEAALQKQTALSMIYYSSFNPHQKPGLHNPCGPHSLLKKKLNTSTFTPTPSSARSPLHSTAPTSQHPAILLCSPMPRSCGHPTQAPESPSLGSGAWLNCFLICDLVPVFSALQPLCPPLQSGN